MVIGATIVLGAPLAQATSFGNPAAVYTAGGISVNGVYYARSGSTLTLTVNTDSAARCVNVEGVPNQSSDTAKTVWTFAVPLAATSTADGVVTKSVTIGEQYNNEISKTCTGNTKVTTSVSYVLDNTGPSVTAALSPQPNAAGWNNAAVAVAWTANDGTGIGGAVVTGNTTVSSDSDGQNVSGYAVDALGNRGPTSTVVVRRDTVTPTITGTRTPAANQAGWNNTDVTVAFTCADALSQVKSCPPATVLGGSGAGQSVGGTAVDNADNTATATVSGISIDKNAPSVTASATVPGGGQGGTPYQPGTWTNQNVTVAFACADQLSGVASCSQPVTLDGEGADQAATGSGTDNAGNTASTGLGDVDIDKTAPNTTATAPVTAWNNTDVAVSLAAADALSGVRGTFFMVDGGPVQAGTAAAFSAEGTHTLGFWSVDNAGNIEDTKTVTIRIDRTPPTISHTASPAPNPNGWANADVTVTFSCGDGDGSGTASGVASCGPDRTVPTEGRDQLVTGTAVDNAGNTATDPATVSIDKTAPTITPSVSSAATPTADGWYNADITVSFECADDLSGVDSCTAPRTLGEGSDQAAAGTAVDAAGNTATAGVSGINVDKTPPALTGTPSTSGWSSGDVTVAWTCTDGGSGVAGVPAPSVVTGEGAELSASAVCTDRAGNSVTATVGGIRIDRAAPATSASVPQPLPSGWYADSVEVTLTAHDTLSGVAATHYAVDGGAPQVYTGPFAFHTAGKHTVGYWSVDAVGNTEDATGHSLTLWVDDAAPTITGNRSPAANAFGWNNTAVTVSFDCADDLSGVAGCTEPVDLATEGSGQSARGTVTDGVDKTASTTVDQVNIDLTAPTVTGAASTDANAAGWYTGDVTIRWTGADGLAGIDPASQPANAVVGGEGRNLGAGPVTVRDRAGNESAPATVTGLNIDRNAPVITGDPITAPNAAGWYRDEVVVDFRCTDPALADGGEGSGVASCPTSKVLKADGANQSVTSDPATDVAGNTAQGRTVSGINVDGTAPATLSNNQCSRTNGWCTGSTANVVLTATDQAGLSGVKEIHYRIDGGAEQVAAGATRTVSVPLDGSGAGTVRYWAVDNAGNVESANEVSLKWDNIAPAVSHTVSPQPNADDWNNRDVTVHFTARDDDAGSGIDPSSVTPDVVVAEETAGRVVEGSARDAAGNTGVDSVTVRLDKTAPVITAAITAGQLGDHGWYTGPVTVHFTCTDPGAAASGIPATACPDYVVLSGNGAGQAVTRTVSDRAGNPASATLGGIAIDRELPTLTTVSVAGGAVYDFVAPAPTCTAADDVSGVDSCVVQITALASPGDYAFVATARDRAGNTTTRSGNYHVNLYRFGGLLQPINDPRIQPGAATSVFKTGSTVPVKFQLRDAGGNLVQARSMPVWLAPVRGGLTTAAVNETTITDPGTPDGMFRWDATAQQYIYNWQTKGLTAGYYYKIGVRLDDGQLLYVT
ncbi:MAG TPA: PxKF domain-containing protein, partial [Pseudonocardiaceae bacterium]